MVLELEKVLIVSEETMLGPMTVSIFDIPDMAFSRKNHLLTTVEDIILAHLAHFPSRARSVW